VADIAPLVTIENLTTIHNRCTLYGQGKATEHDYEGQKELQAPQGERHQRAVHRSAESCDRGCRRSRRSRRKHLAAPARPPRITCGGVDWEGDKVSVYFAQRRRGGLIKIGWSRSVRGRLTAVKAKMIGAIAGDREIEKKLHKRFAHLRVRGEWFKPGDELLTFIRVAAQEHEPDTSDAFQTAFRIPNLLLSRVDKIANQMSTPGKRINRSEAIRMALYRGVDQLESEGKKR